LGHRVGQFIGHLTARVAPGEIERARPLLPDTGWALFSAMPTADRRHALDVAARLAAVGQRDPDLLAAALLHDAAKGHRMRLWHRVAGVLLEAVAPRTLARLALPAERSWRYPFHLYLQHAALSADAALAAGCSQRTVAFIRGSTEPADAPLAAALRRADEGR
jgi:predicted HD phosphohydrolase